MASVIWRRGRRDRAVGDAVRNAVVAQLDLGQASCSGHRRCRGSAPRRPGAARPADGGNRRQTAGHQQALQAADSRCGQALLQLVGWWLPCTGHRYAALSSSLRAQRQSTLGKDHRGRLVHGGCDAVEARGRLVVVVDETGGPGRLRAPDRVQIIRSTTVSSRPTRMA